MCVITSGFDVNVDINEHDKLVMENVFASCMTIFSTDL